MSKIKLIGLSILSGLLLWAAWPMSPLFPFVFIGFIPLLWVEKILSEGEKSGRKVFLYSYITLFVWNVTTTWWVYHASAWGGVAAVVCNALLQSLPFLAFHHTKKIAGAKAGYIALPIYWIAFEYLHLSWDLTWSWLTLGNVFAMFPSVVQWYEYTGVLGGSLWIWVVNILVFLTILNWKTSKKLVAPIFFIVVPVLVSFYLGLQGITIKEKTFEVMVVQPNINAYTQKFSHNAATGEKNTETFIPYKKQLEILLNLTEENLTKTTQFVLWPETALPKGYWEENLDTYEMVKQLQMFAKKHKITLITGADTYKRYANKESASVSARNQNGVYFDVFNTALLVNEKGQLSTYHKSKLVPGVEKMPYPKLFGFLEYFAIDLGGTMGSLGTQEERSVLKSIDGIGCAPVICYESIFGGFTTGYFENDADFIGVITNDGWWRNTQGHKQHFQYARLRAIENRSYVARAANTGISGFINRKGEIIGETLDWDEQGVLIADIGYSNPTFYTKYGDFIGRIFSFIAVALLLSLIAKKIKNKL